MRKLFNIIKQNNYWILVTLVYLTLIYSAALQYAYGPEATIRPLGFYQGEEHVLKGTEDISLKKYFPNFGILRGLKLVTTGSFLWKSSSHWGDAAFYLLQTKSLDLSIPPYKYRFLPTVLVRLISTVTGLNAPKSFVLMNVIFTILTSLLFTYYLIHHLNFSRTLSLIGGILFITMVPNTRTIAFPLLEPASLFFCMLIFIAVKTKNIPLFILSSLCGVASKEILVISAILWFVTNLPSKSKISAAMNILISSIPIIGFMLIRASLGAPMLEVNFGYNLLAGEFPKHGKRLFDIKKLILLLESIFLSFSFLWAGLINIRKNRFLQKSAIIIPIVIIATVLLSGRIARILGILFPIIIPLFLIFFKKDDIIESKLHIFGAGG